MCVKFVKQVGRFVEGKEFSVYGLLHKNFILKLTKWRVVESENTETLKYKKSISISELFSVMEM